MRLITLRPLIETAWSIDTTWSPDTYEGKDRAWGQCGVTTLYLKDQFGWSMAAGTAITPDGFLFVHYWSIAGGIDIDLTARQFPVGTIIVHPIEATLDMMAGDKWLMDRYAVFAKRVRDLQQKVAPTSVM